jgi:hypothetical protein
MVSASYLSDYHVHTQKKSDRTRSHFQIQLSNFADSITRLGTIRKLVQITNGLWLTPEECAQDAVNEAGSTKFPFCVQYSSLASANDNDVELVTDQYLLNLQWQPAHVHQPLVPGNLFLHSICGQVFDQVNFLIKFSFKSY